MGFISFAARNIFRSKLRLIFTLILLTLGIMAVYFGAQKLPIFLPSNTEIMSGADFSISNMDDNSNYTFSLEELNNIQSMEGVTESTGTLILSGISSKNLSGEELKSSIILMGFKGVDIANNSSVPGVGSIKLIKGRLINERSYEIVVTQDLCKTWNLDIGDNITLYNPRSRVQYQKESGSQEPGHYNKSSNINFTIVGIVANSLNHGGEFMQRASGRPKGIIGLDVANELIYNSSDLKFDFINVKTDPKQLDQVKNTIQQSNPKYVIWDEKLSHDIPLSELKTLLLSLFVGGLLLLVATLKSISERIREFGVLKALGWNNKRIIAMVFMEITIQTVIAWMIASVIIVVDNTMHSDMGLSYLAANITHISPILIVTLILSLIMPIIGILLPIIYIMHLKPTEALKYE